MSFAQQVKDKLFHIITDMSSNVDQFTKNPEHDFSRTRKLDFSTLLSAMLSMETGTTRDELLKYFSYDVNTVSNSAFYQQRAKLNSLAFPHLFRSFNDCYPCNKFKNNYQLIAVDGCSFTMTRNPSDIDSYFAPNDKSSKGYNQIHVIPAYDLLSKRYLDCVVQPIRKKNEFQAMCQLIDNHDSLEGVSPIFIADRGFHSLNVFAHAIEHNSLFLIRATDIKMNRLLAQDLPEDTTFDVSIHRILSRTRSKKNHLHPEQEAFYKYVYKEVTFDYIDDNSPEYDINLRIVRFQISEDGYENIITNLPIEDFSVDDIKELYHLRWGIETSFRELKYAIGALNFHSKIREFIEMEVWIRLLLYNFCSIITEYVAINRKGKKHLLQVNYTAAYKACLYLLRLHNGENPPNIEGLIEKHTLPIRPDRKYARQHRFRVPINFTYRYA